ncbi:YjcQ protein [Paenibacillus uliginis N3/975]|uniref:YjcQ protein n=1 Tax=Paenibacillus uliginis N3/975 TaxID=1313296 RepID=A0A1X7HK78_9BACL|nr:YjcQ family protein [Paenibacillus uliginis]SMF88185.1 YjcQ protein [Paenibacillus uliginis N3/975]
MNKERLRYAILKEVNEGNTPLTEEDFDVSENEFDDAVNFLSREKYLTGLLWAGDRPHLHKIGPVLTERGEKYLNENSILSKTYRGLKEVREWIKL